jgi:hypothetical protein
MNATLVTGLVMDAMRNSASACNGSPVARACPRLTDSNGTSSRDTSICICGNLPLCT